LRAECSSIVETLPDDAWLCPEPRSVECSGGAAELDEILYVPDSSSASCADQVLSVSEAGPFGVGVHEIVVTNGRGDELCTTELTVTDSQPPTLTPKTLNLWPPNHKFHSVAVEDCVEVQDACQPNLRAEFIWASSDEPEDAKGDGHHAPDILVDDCQHVQLRAERQGPKDGRVYKLGVRVEDGSGNAAESVCTVIVDHDQRGVQGADSGEAYRIALNGQNGQPLCDGANEPPAPPASEDAGAPEPTAPDAGTPEPVAPDAGAEPETPDLF
jgi:hypothetical protein